MRMKRKTGQKIRMRRARPGSLTRMRTWINIIMLLALLGQNVFAPIVSAVDGNGLITTSESQPSGENKEETGAVEGSVTETAEQGVSAPPSEATGQESQETPQAEAEKAADATSETNQSPAETSETPNAESKDAQASTTEEIPVEIRPETELTDAEELTAEELAEQQLAPLQFSTRSLSLPTEADGKKIETFNIEWLTQDTTDNGQADNLFQKWDDDKEKAVRFRLSFSMSGKNNYEPGDIQIKLPRYIFKTRDGQPTGSLSLAVPEAPDQSGTFQYYLDKGEADTTDDDAYIIINTRKLSAASQGYIDGTIGKLVPHTIKDIATGYKASLGASLQVVTEMGTTIGKEVEPITVQVDTSVRLSGALKTSSNYSTAYPSGFPSQLKPANPDDYYYIQWTAHTDVPDAVNQPSVLSFTDTASSYQADKTVLLLGYTVNGETKAGNNTNTLTGTIFDGFTRNERHYVTIYAAYPKAEFPEVAERDHWVKNHIRFTLTGKDDEQAITAEDDDRQNIREIRGTDIARHALWKHGYNTYQAGLTELQADNPVTVSYRISGSDFSYPSIKTDDVGGTGSRQITITDDKVSFDGHTELTGEDAEFAYLNFDTPIAYKYGKMATEGRAYYEGKGGRLLSGLVEAGAYAYQTTTDASTYPTYRVQGKTETGSYVDMATVSFASGKASITPSNGATASGAVLRFPSGTSDYRVIVDSDLAGLHYNFTVGMTVKPSARVKQYIETASNAAAEPTVTVYNTAKVEVEKPSGDKLYTGESTGFDYLRAFRVRVDLDKEITTYTNDIKNRNVRLHYTSTANIVFSTSSADDVKKAVNHGLYKEEKQATWYDLLPEAVVPDLTTVKGRAGDSVKTVHLLPNYKNTGRTLMVVKMTLSPHYHWHDGRLMDRPTLSFDANYSWYNMNTYGSNPRNIVAYQSANDTLGTVKGWQGEPDNPLAGRNGESKAAVGEHAATLTDLDASTDTNSFIYAVDKTPLEVDTAAVSSLVKEVAVNGNGLYGDGRSENNDRTVYEGGNYDYRMGVTAAYATTLRDIVFYDLLESYVPKAVDADYQDEQWKGTFQSIDLSELKKKGINPVVYYSTTKNLQISETERAHADLTNTAIWSTTIPADRSKITAIAVDARRKTDGSEFVLEEHESISAYLRMKAPWVDDIRGTKAKADYYDQVLAEGQQEAGLTGGVHAYNNVKMTSVSTSAGQVENLFIEYNYVKVGLRPHRITVKKTWDDGNDRDRIRPERAVVRLHANGEATSYTATLSEENKWQHTWESVPYTDDDGHVITYSVEEEAITGYRMQLDSMTITNDGRTYAIRNIHEPETLTIKGTKNWVNDDNTTRPENIRVVLLRDGVPYQTKIVTPNEAGQWNYTFADLYKYDAGREIKYKVTEPDYIAGYKSSITGHDITNEYDPYGDLKISKEVIGLTDGNKDNLFAFTVEITDAQGLPDATSYDYETSDGRTGKVQTGGKIFLKHGQTATIKRVRSEHGYKITEADRPGYTRTSGEMLGTIRAGQTSAVDVVNTYKATGEATVEYTKVLRNRDLKPYQFIFDIYDAQGTVVRSGSNLRNGNILFGGLRYTQADAGKTYHYRVKERDTGSPGYTYDQTTHEFTVQVTDNGDGTLTATPTYQTTGGTSTTFTNTYKASGKLSLRAWKVMKHGEALQAGAFSFNLKEVGETAVLATGQNATDGSIRFSELSYTQDDIGQTYYYEASEVTGTDDRVVYDQTTVRYAVTVKDNGDGTLGFDVVMTDSYTADINNATDTPIFVNRYKDGSLRIQKSITSGSADQEFRFKVKLTPPPGATVPSGKVTGTRTQASGPMITFTVTNRPDLKIEPIFLDVSSDGEHYVGLGRRVVPGVQYWAVKSSYGTTHLTRYEEISYTVSEGKVTDIYAVSEFGFIKSLKPFLTGGGYILHLDGYAEGQASPSPTREKGLLTRLTSFFQAGVDKLDRALFPRVEAATITPTGTVVQTGTTGTVTWEIYSDGILYFKPTNGVSGTMAAENSTITNPWRNHLDKFTKIGVAPGVKAPASSRSLFSGLRNVTDMDLENLDVSEVTDMSYMFYGASKLKQLEVSNWNVGNVLSMRSMFAEASILTTIPVQNWNVSKVTDMEGMFDTARNLTTLPVENWDVRRVTSMKNMFARTLNLTTLPVQNWNVSNVTTMEYMFIHANNLTDLSVGNWDVGRVTNMEGMFERASKLTTLPVENWNVSNVTNMSRMFLYASGLTSLPIASWDVRKVTDMNRMFSNASGLTDLPVQNWDVGNVTNMAHMFNGVNLTSLPIGNWNVSNVTDMSGMFYEAKKLTSLPVENWDVGKVTTMSSMFAYASSLTSLPIGNWNVSNVTTMRSMFQSAISLRTLPVENWDVGKVTDMSNMFSYMWALTTLPVQNWNVSKVTDMSSMFQGASSLTFLLVDDWNVRNVTSMSFMFRDTTRLTFLPVFRWNVSNVTSMNSMFQGSSSITSLSVESWDVSKVTDMASMFSNASNLTTLPVENWNVGNVTTMARMFAQASSLSTLPVQNWNVSNVTDMTAMFANTRSLVTIPVQNWNVGKVRKLDSIFERSGLTSIDIENWNVSNVTSINHLFYGASSLTTLSLRNWDVSKIRYSSIMIAESGIETLDLSNWGPFRADRWSSMLDSRKLRVLKLSPNMSLAYTSLNNPPTNAEYTGKWIREDKAYGPFTASELMANYTPAMAGTWIWEEKPKLYTIAFDANGGTGSMANQTATVDTAYTLPSNGFAKIGYRFKEWNTRWDGGGTAYAVGQSVTNLAAGNQTVTLYAIWEQLDNSVTIQDGSFEITLKGGEAWTLPNLPAGTTYEVYEETPAGWVLTQAVNTTGTIKPSETATAAFINAYQPGKTSYQLGAKKLLDGNGAAGYSFTLTNPATGQVLQTVQSTEGGGVLFESITYTSPGDYVYEIAEVAGSDPKITYDTHKETVTVQVRANAEGNLVATPSKANADMVFNNQTKTGNLSVSKQILGTLKGNAPTFTIKVHLNGGRETRTLQLTEGQTETIADLPYGTTYTIEETDLPAGFALVRIDGQSGTIGAPSAAATVYNTYRAQGSVNIEAKKILDNSQDTSRVLKPLEFTFELVDKGADLDSPADDTIIATASNDGFGAVSFGAVTFTEPGNKTYYIREVAGLDTRVTYDSHEEAVQVQAVDNGDGTMTVTASYDADKAVFTNLVKPPSRTPDPTFGAVDITKEVTSLTEANRTKDFDLRISLVDAQGEELSGRFAYTSNKRADGTVAHDETIAIRHDERIRIVNLPEGAVVKATETVPNGYSLDRTSVIQGAVVANTTTTLRLINNYTATGSWRPKGTKSITGGTLEAGQFTFLVLKDGREIQRATNKATGEITFEDIAYSLEDVGKTYTYEIMEVNDRRKGIVYDRTVYTYTVTIKDDGLGKIVPEIGAHDGATPHKNAPSADFVNIYATYPDTGGFGSAIWIGSGSFIMLAAMYLYYKRRKEEA